MNLRRNAFPNRARLSGAKSFKALFGAKLAARSERFIVQAARNDKIFARLGIVVGKRMVSRAVARNFLKRLIRESFRHQQDRLRGYDVLVRVRRQVIRKESTIAAVELTHLLLAVVE